MRIVTNRPELTGPEWRLATSSGVFSMFPRSDERVFETIYNGEEVDIVGNLFTEHKLNRTLLHSYITRSVIYTALSLQQDRFAGKSGIGHNVMIGSRGTGRSTTLTALATVIPKIFPDVIVVYAQMGMLYETSIAQVIDEELAYHNEAYRTPTPDPCYLGLAARLQQTLYKHNLKVLLLLDDVEALYTPRVTEQYAQQTLREIDSFSRSSSGRLIMCMFTCTTHVLNCKYDISEDKRKFLEARYPLVLKGWPLRPDRLEFNYLPSPRPTDLHTVAALSGLSLNDTTKPWCRAVAFLTGCDAHSIVTLSLKPKYTSAIEVPSVSLCEEGLRAVISRQLFHQNKQLLCNLFDCDGNTVVNKICRLPWEKRLRPVAYKDVKQAWKNIVNMRYTRDVARGELEMFDYNLADLRDSGVIRLREDYIYPRTIASLMPYVQDDPYFGAEVHNAIKRVVREAPAVAAALTVDPCLLSTDETNKDSCIVA